MAADEWEYEYDSEVDDSPDDEGDSSDSYDSSDDSGEGDLPQYDDSGDQTPWEPDQYLADQQPPEEDSYDNLWAYQGSTSDTGMGYAPEQPQQQNDPYAPDQWRPMYATYAGDDLPATAPPTTAPITQPTKPAPADAWRPTYATYAGDDAQDQRVFTAPQPQDQPQAQAPSGGAAVPKGEIDNSSRQSFIRTSYAYALEAADGDPVLAQQLVATAISENGKVGTGRSLGEMGFNVGGIQGVEGTAGSFTALDAGRPRQFAAYNNLSEGFRAVRDLVSTGRYAQAAATYRQTGDVDRYWRDVNAAGYAEDPNWATKVGSIRRDQVTPLTQDLATQPQATQPQAQRTAPPASLSGITPEQFGLGDADAESICGPVLMMAFAKANGRNPTIAEAKQVAAQNGGWTSAKGMGGPEATAAALRAMDIPAHYAPGPLDIETIRRETQNGNPVGINTLKHYFVVEGVDEQGRLDLGNSAANATRAAAGRRWFFPGEIEGLGMGAPTGALYKDSPSSLIPSVAVKETGMKPASTVAGPRAAANAALPAGHYDGDGDDHGVAKPYAQQQVDKAGNVWTVAFDYDQPYKNPYNPDVPNHRGVDLRATGVENGGMNMPYQAFRDGVVTDIVRDEHGGIGVVVDTGDATARYDRYFHNNAVSVKIGDRVVAGQTNVGLLGQTGTEGFPHLHYEVSQNKDGDPNGQTIDPRPYMSPPGQATPSQRAAAAANPAPGQAAASPTRTFVAPAQVPGATYTLGDKPVSYDEYAKAVVQQQESRQKFIDSLPAQTQQAYTQWEAYRQSRKESTADMDEFSAHLDRIGAPNPFREDRENHDKFVASLPGPTQQAFTEWEAYRKANGQPTDIPSFREHLDRLGAPNPWREQEEANARIAQANAESKAKYDGWLATLPPSTAKAVPEWQEARRQKGEDPNDQAALSAYLDHYGIENPFKPQPGAATGGGTAAPGGGRTVYHLTNPDGSPGAEITEAQANEINQQNASLNRYQRSPQ